MSYNQRMTVLVKVQVLPGISERSECRGAGALRGVVRTLCMSHTIDNKAGLYFQTEFHVTADEVKVRT